MALAITKRIVRRENQPLKDDNNPIDLKAKSDQCLDLLSDTALDIAITGVAGAGKSSLVNSLQGMSDKDEGAAKVGDTETTMERKCYRHPTFPNVRVWDLPGIGTVKFNAKQYLKKVHFKEYDVFIIVSSDRFTESDVLLAREIQKMNKKLYYVRNKIDQCIESGRRRDSGLNEEEYLERIRNYCCDSLRKSGESNPGVFLISSWEWNMYGFPSLQKTLESNLDDLKRQVLIEAMPAFSIEALKKKKVAMESLIQKVACLSCVPGAIPVPGLSFVCDTGILVATMKHFYTVFGLDEGSLRRLANRIGKDVDVLKSGIKKTSRIDEITIESVIDLLIKAGLQYKVMPSKMSLALKPVFGCLAGGSLSYVTVLYTLRNFLEDVVEDAEKVVAKILESQSN